VAKDLGSKSSRCRAFNYLHASKVGEMGDTLETLKQNLKPADTAVQN